MTNTNENTEVENGTETASPVECLVMLHGNDELPENRRECLVTTNFSVDPYLAKYNDSTGKWMIAFEKDLAATNAQIKNWVYVDEIFAA